MIDLTYSSVGKAFLWTSVDPGTLIYPLKAKPRHISVQDGVPLVSGPTLPLTHPVHTFKSMTSRQHLAMVGRHAFDATFCESVPHCLCTDSVVRPTKNYGSGCNVGLKPVT